MGSIIAAVIAAVVALHSGAPVASRVALGCFPGEGFVERVVGQAGERASERFALGSGFVAIYRDGSWLHIAEFGEQPCIVASGSRSEMATYFEVE